MYPEVINVELERIRRTGLGHDFGESCHIQLRPSNVIECPTIRTKAERRTPRDGTTSDGQPPGKSSLGRIRVDFTIIDQHFAVLTPGFQIASIFDVRAPLADLDMTIRVHSNCCQSADGWQSHQSVCHRTVLTMPGLEA